MAGFSTFFNESDDLEREIKRADNSNPLSGDVVQFDADGNLIAAEGGGGGGGTTINPTDNAIPVRSDATTFVDSPITIGAGVGLTTDLADIDTNGDGDTFNALQGGNYLGTRADGITAYYDGSGVFPDPGGWVTGSVVTFAADFVTADANFSNEVAGNSYTITGVAPQANNSDGAIVNHAFEFTLGNAIVVNISTQAVAGSQIAGQVVIVEAGADATTVTGDLTVTGTINSLITTTATAAGITDILNNGNSGSITSSSPTVPGFTTNNPDIIPTISFGAVQPLDSNGVGIPDGTQFSGLVVTDDNDAQIRTWTATWQVVFDVEWFIYGDVVASNFIFDGGTETWDVAYSNQPELIVDLRTITATVPASATVTGDLSVTGTTTLAITDEGTARPFQFRIADSGDTGLEGFITFVRE